LYDALLDDDDATRTRVAPKGFEDVVESNVEAPEDESNDTTDTVDDSSDAADQLAKFLAAERQGRSAGDLRGRNRITGE